MLKLTTDHIFHIGQQHLRSGMPCQDYAVSGLAPDGAYAIVSDGCSGGGRTEVGAQILTLASALALRERAGKSQREASDEAYWSMRAAREVLALNQNDMLATLVVARAGSKEGGACVDFIGDGACAFGYRDGSFDVIRVEWQNNTPLYLAYRDDNNEGFIRAHGGGYSFACNIDRVHFSANGERRDLPRMGLPIQLALDLGVYVLPGAERLDFIAAFTDGVSQVDGMDWTDVIRELLAFKSRHGDFAKRRMHGFLRDAAKRGRGPLDDIGYAVIQIEGSI